MILYTNDVRNLFIRKYQLQEFRILGSGNDRQQTKTIELQGIQFIVDKPWIIREPNLKYFKNELAWYDSQSLNVNDIPGGAPIMWKQCATELGYINSNYGWCIYSNDNGNQYENCKNKLIDDQHTREAIMIYNRPSMQQEYNKDGMHDFMCCQNVQYFINDEGGNSFLDCIVNFRSNDAVYGFNNDALWMLEVLKRLANDLSKELNKVIYCGRMIWNAGSLHIYERHFNLINI